MRNDDTAILLQGFVRASFNYLKNLEDSNGWQLSELAPE